MSPPVFVCGVGCSPFSPPKARDWNYPDMVKISASEALADAGIGYEKVDAVVASYCYGEPTCGQRAVYQLGLTGVPVFNVNNNCSSGSSALMLARHLVQSGAFHCVMAVGFEKMERGLSEKYSEQTSPVDRHFARIGELGAPPQLLKGLNAMTSEVIRIFAFAAREYAAKYPGAVANSDFATIAVKNRRHGNQNPRACFYKVPLVTPQAAETERMMCEPITVHQSSMTADGSACALLCSSHFRQNSLSSRVAGRCVSILAQSMVSDLPSTFERGFISLSGFDMSKAAAENCYRESGVWPSAVDVVELHDCFAANELLMYEALGLAEEGGAARLLRSGRWEPTKDGGEIFRMGRWVVNASGGLEAKGHPIGATGLAQAHELVTQLRGDAQKRQVPGARIGLQHNFGIGGAAVCTLYEGPQSAAKL